MTAGAVLGFHNNTGQTLADCPECFLIANRMRNINYGIFFILENIAYYTQDFSKFSISISTVLTVLVQIGTVFNVFIRPIDDMFQDKNVMDLFDQFFKILQDPAMLNVMVSNFELYGETLMMLIMTVPGDNCYQIGYKIGSVARKMFSVIWKGSSGAPPKNKLNQSS